jgi:hypothetical protein
MGPLLTLSWVSLKIASINGEAVSARQGRERAAVARSASLSSTADDVLDLLSFSQRRGLSRQDYRRRMPSWSSPSWSSHVTRKRSLWSAPQMSGN